MEQKIARFEIKDLLPIAMTLVIAGIALVYGISVIGDVKDTVADCGGIGQTADNFTYNASNNLCYNTSLSTAPNLAPTGDQGTAFYAANDTLTGIAKIPNKLPLIVTVIVAAIIIGILVRYLLIKFS